MRFLEKLPLSPEPEFRLGLDEEDLEVFALALIETLEKNPSAATALLALTLSEVLLQIGGVDYRHYHKLAKRLKKLSSSTKR